MDLSDGYLPSFAFRSDHRSQQTFPARTESTVPSSQSSQNYGPSLSSQNSRLNLRNVDFRRTKSSSHRLGARISRFFSGPETPQSGPAPQRNQENTSPQNQSTHSPSPSLGTLQEISKSSRSRSSQKRSNIRIAEDDGKQPLLNISPAAKTHGSWYHDASSAEQSQVNFHSTDAEFGTMKPREISGNERRSPIALSSPLAKQERGRRNGGSDIRKTTFEPSEYIEHIENEVQQVKEAMHSPKTDKALQEKLRTLQAVNKYLKDTVSKLEEDFDERVKQAVEHKTAVEVDMHRKIKALEEELAAKENTIRNLEHNIEESKYDGSSLDALRAVIDRMDQEKACLEEANRVVEKRNEALTELLAQSPTRSHHGFELPSPIRLDSRRTPRPESMMMPKMPSSPRMENCCHARSLQPSPTRYSTNYFNPITALKLEQNHPCNAAGETDPRKVFDSASLDFGLGESCSVRSAACGGPGRSSTPSNASTSPSAWSLPLPMSPSDYKATVRQNKHRRTRRFESGSTQLKPLLLSTIASEGNAFQTFSTTNLCSSPTRREFSEQSLDPTTSFLSQQFETPIQAPALPSDWVSETALKAFEASSEPHFQSFEEGITKFLNRAEPSAMDEQMFSSLHGAASFEVEDQDGTWRDRSGITLSKWQSSPATVPGLHSTTGNGVSSDYRPLHQVSADSSQGLMPELFSLQSETYRTRGTSNLAAQRAPITSVQGDRDDSPIPRKRQRSSDPESCSFVMPTLCVNPAHEAGAHNKPLSEEHVRTPKALTDTSTKSRRIEPSSRPRSPLETLHKRTASPAPLTSVTVRTILDTLSRYTRCVRILRRDPIALVRRLIANIWHSNWKRLGKLSWWVLGLFLGPGARRKKLGDAHSTGYDWERHDEEAIAGKICGPESSSLQQEGTPSLRQPLPVASDSAMVGFDDSDAGYQNHWKQDLGKNGGRARYLESEEIEERLGTVSVPLGQVQCCHHAHCWGCSDQWA